MNNPNLAEQWSHLMQPLGVWPMIAALFGLLMLLAGFGTKMFASARGRVYYNPNVGTGSIVAGIVLAMPGVLIPVALRGADLMLRMFSGVLGSQDDPKPKPTPAPKPDPAPAHHVDFTPFLVGLGLVTLAVVVGAVAFVVVRALVRSHRRAAAVTDGLRQAFASTDGRFSDLKLTQSEAEHDLVDGLRLTAPALFEMTRDWVVDWQQKLIDADDVRLRLVDDDGMLRREVSEDLLSQYSTKVSAARSSWQTAVGKAKRIGLTDFGTDEQQRLKRARNLLASAGDGRTRAERQSFYRQAMKLLEGLVEVDDKTRTALEQRYVPELTA